VSASWDNTLKEWNLETGKCLLDLPVASEPSHYFTNVTSHGTLPMVLTSSSDGSFRLWDLRAASQLVITTRGHNE
jgi:WD40 repeat protein